MKKLCFIALATFTLDAYGQNKHNYVHFNKLTEVTGTDYVIASVEHWGKIFTGAKSKYLLFIDTKTGQTNRVDFPEDGHIGQVTQIKIDSLGINRIIVAAKTIDLNGKKGIDWDDPQQVILLSADGKEKNQLTEDKFFMSTWTANHQTGTIVVTGHYDTNNNNKYDKKDKSEIVIYDLKTLKLIRKI